MSGSGITSHDGAPESGQHLPGTRAGTENQETTPT